MTVVEVAKEELHHSEYGDMTNCKYDQKYYIYENGKLAIFRRYIQDRIMGIYRRRTFISGRLAFEGSYSYEMIMNIWHIGYCH